MRNVETFCVYTNFLIRWTRLQQKQILAMPIMLGNGFIDDRTNPPTEISTQEDPPKEEIATNETSKNELEEIIKETPKTETPKVENPHPKKQEINYIALADNYTDPIRFENNIRGAANEANTYKEALGYLVKKEYDLGITKLSELLNIAPNDNIRYNLALAYFQEKKFDQAILLFTEVIQNEYFHIDQAQWLLVLSYFQIESIEKAKEILLEINKDGDHPKYEKALALRKELNR